MDLLSYSDYRNSCAEVEEAVLRTPEISRFCSGPVWQCAAHDQLYDLSPGARHIIAREGNCHISFVERQQPRIFYPFESSWMFGVPLLGPPGDSLDLLEKVVSETLQPPLGFCIGGVKKQGQLHRELQERKQQWVQFEEFEGTDNMIIDLGEGSEAWLARRSKKFRKSLRQNLGLEGLEVVDPRDEAPDSLLDRILAIQRASYKWNEGTDIFLEPRYVRFYRQILTELHQAGDLRLLFAQEEGKDVAYIFGGVAGDTYRGFQTSYLESVKSRGVGNALQYENIRRIAAEGIKNYDLGMHSEYKERWADRREEYVAMFLVFA